MNGIVFVAIFAVLAVSVEGLMSKADMVEVLTKLGAQCMAEARATPDDLENLKGHAVPTTAAGKCALACIYKNLGVMNDDKLFIEGLVELAKKMMGDDKEKIALIKTVATECDSTAVGKDGCDTAAKLMQCFIDGSKKNKVEMPV